MRFSVVVALGADFSLNNYFYLHIYEPPEYAYTIICSTIIADIAQQSLRSLSNVSIANYWVAIVVVFGRVQHMSALQHLIFA